jgi:NADP-dependent 3-hydroxy acid dehydrogenase YdfG
MSQEIQPNKRGLVVITGASSGIGLECTKRFAKEGYPVLALARSIDEMKKQLGSISNVMIEKCDVTNLKEFESCIQKAEQAYGQTQCLVNNAGVMFMGLVHEQDYQEWYTMIDTNVKGYLNGIKCVVDAMKQRRSGCVINISSLAGTKNYDNHTVYCGTKAAIQLITEGLRKELAESNVKVISICPGCVQTEIAENTTNQKIREEYEKWRQSMELGILQPEDVANACLFAYQQPPRCCVREIHLAPTNQVE